LVSADETSARGVGRLQEHEIRGYSLVLLQMDEVTDTESQ
jgi:hypothetical protein